MTELPPVFRPLSNETYLNNLGQRVKESDMRTGMAYSLVAQLDLTLYGDIGEFQARVDYIEPIELGKAALVLCLFEPATNQALLTFDGHSEDGIISPDQRHRITHPYLNNIGVITKGYLLNNPDEPSITEDTNPRELNAHAEYTDTRTRAFATHGIILGRE